MLADLPIKAIPTTYGGTRFRSRLEARWAAFFDLVGWKWEYEPVDFDGWCPDFLVHRAVPVYAEVKPVGLRPAWRNGPLILDDSDAWAKAQAHWRSVWVLCLGSAPSEDADYFSIGHLSDPPDGAAEKWFDVNRDLGPENETLLWREAGNRVQWRAR